MHYFQGMVVSADVGLLKPDQRIFQYLLNKYQLKPTESIFIDDMINNVESALSLGTYAFQFTDAASCKAQLHQTSINLN